MLNKRADKLELLRIAEAVALEKSIDKELIIDSNSEAFFNKEEIIEILNNGKVIFNKSEPNNKPCGMYYIKSGDFRTLKVYPESPIDLLTQFEKVGIKEVYVVDLGSAKMHEKNNFNLLEMMSQFTKIKINYSGGMRNSEQVSNAFIHGAKKVTLGSMPVYDKDLFLNCLTTWGFKKLVLAVDILNKSLRINGWKYQTKIDPIDHIKYFHKKGLKNIKAVSYTHLTLPTNREV